VSDLTIEQDIEAATQTILAGADGLDVLVHSAGVLQHGSLESLPVVKLDLQYAVNVRAPFQLTQLLLPALRARRGKVVFVNSSVGGQAREFTGSYAASKQALRTLADTLRAEENRFGVRVASIYPGRTATAMQQAVHEWEGRQMHGERLLQPEDVAYAVLTVLGAPDTAEITDLHLRPMSPS
jgi:NAD(P)-dependent dehydrogenase (short-subunit alcohol dehydrogenase family)